MIGWIYSVFFRISHYISPMGNKLTRWPNSSLFPSIPTVLLLNSTVYIHIFAATPTCFCAKSFQVCCFNPCFFFAGCKSYSCLHLLRTLAVIQHRCGKPMLVVSFPKGNHGFSAKSWEIHHQIMPSENHRCGAVGPMRLGRIAFGYSTKSHIYICVYYIYIFKDSWNLKVPSNHMFHWINTFKYKSHYRAMNV